MRIPLCRFAIIFLIILVSSIPSFCGEIHEAAKAGDLEKVKALLDKNPELVSSKDHFSMIPLHWAAAKGHKKVAELLLANKDEVDVRDDCGDSPLYYAAKYGHKDVMELLMTKGGNVNAKDQDAWMPLHIAASEGHKDVIELLLANKADINARTKNGDTPLRVASYPSAGGIKTHEGIVETWVIMNPHNDVVELLRQHGGHE